MTANYGGRDSVRPQHTQNVPDVDWLCVTDDPESPAPLPFATLVAPDPAVHPNMAAKWWRTHPPFEGIAPEFTPRAPYDHVIWIDANMQVVSGNFVQGAVGSLRDGIAAWAHPRRRCVYDEIEASLGAEAQGGRYDHLPLREQGAAYRAEGFPEQWGLWATGTLVWTPESARLLGDEWYEECCKWGYQDQVSFPVVCWRHGVRPGVFPLGQTEGRYHKRQGFFRNGWLILHDHNAGTT